MTKDYAKPSTTRKPGKAKTKAKSGTKARPKAKTRTAKPKKAAPLSRGKPIFILILLLGAFSYALYYLQSIPPTASTSTKAKQKSVSAKTIKEPSQTETKETSQRFKFYDILPESEVVPPKVEAYHFKEKTQSDKYHYLVQTGSFRQLKDAERQKATIAFQGLKANIKSVEGKNGNKWHRVMTGPFYDRSQMNSALDKLVAINIEPLVKKVKKSK